MITVIQRINQINVTYENPMRTTPVLRDFFFSATEGQTVFTLTGETPLAGGIFKLFVNGAQKIAADFVRVNKVITLDDGVHLGDAVYGSYEF